MSNSFVASLIDKLTIEHRWIEATSIILLALHIYSASAVAMPRLAPRANLALLSAKRDNNITDLDFLLRD
jgi:hypothetical protein